MRQPADVLEETASEQVHQQLAHGFGDTADDAAANVTPNEKQQKERHDAVALKRG